MDITPDPVADIPSPHAGLSQNQKLALVGLGGFTILALVLSVVVRRRGNRDTVRAEYIDASSPDWETSLRHFAGVVDLRFQGMQQQLDALHRVAGTVDDKIVTNAVSPFDFVPAPPNGEVVSPVATAAVGANEPAPPGPAAVSD